MNARGLTRGRMVCFTAAPWWAPNVLTKLWNRDMLGWTWLSGVPNFTRRLGEVSLTGGGTCRTKDFDAQVRICIKRVKQVYFVMELV